MITEEQFRQFVRDRVDKHYYVTASALALMVEYVFDMKGWRFDKLRSVAENEMQLYKKIISK